MNIRKPAGIGIYFTVQNKHNFSLKYTLLYLKRVQNQHSIDENVTSKS
jgi:hypothetical protein